MADPKYLTIEHLSTKDIIRIFSKISVDPITECWNWTASINSNGYGQIRYEGRIEKAHRLLYAWLIEPLPMGCGRNIPQLDHKICDNPSCCNPAHLLLSSQRENVLRGKGVSAVNIRKTHCIRGHLLPTEWNRHDGRYCIACDRAHKKTPEYLAYKRRRYHIRGDSN